MGTDKSTDSESDSPTFYVSPDAIVVENITIHQMIAKRGLNPFEAMITVEVSGTTVSRELSTITLIANPVLAVEWALVLSTSAQKASEDLLRIQQESDNTT